MEKAFLHAVVRTLIFLKKKNYLIKNIEMRKFRLSNIFQKLFNQIIIFFFFKKKKSQFLLTYKHFSELKTKNTH